MPATVGARKPIPALAQQSELARDVWEGLSASPKTLPSKYFYDARGSRLFQQITESDDYYLTRCEREILETHGPAIGKSLARGPMQLVELGAGDGHKTEILIQHLLEGGRRFDYLPVDICRQALDQMAQRLLGRLGSAVAIEPIEAEYFDALAMLRKRGGPPKLVLFLGSNIGNFTPHATRQFLRSLRRALRPGDQVLIGFDLKKNLNLLHQAYNDSAGLTSEFNYNLLQRINRELNAEFDRRRFMHVGSYNVGHACMESWLVSLEQQTVPIRALGCEFSFEPLEGIHVESSYKYDLGRIEALADIGGFRIVRHFYDRRCYFVDSLWEVPG